MRRLGGAAALLLLALTVRAAAGAEPRIPPVSWSQDVTSLTLTFALPTPVAGAPEVHVNASHVRVAATAGTPPAAFAVSLALREDVVAETAAHAADRRGVRVTLRKRVPHRFDRLLVRGCAAQRVFRRVLTPRPAQLAGGPVCAAALAPHARRGRAGHGAGGRRGLGGGGAGAGHGAAPRLSAHAALRCSCLTRAAQPTKGATVLTVTSNEELNVMISSHDVAVWWLRCLATQHSRHPSERRC